MFDLSVMTFGVDALVWPAPCVAVYVHACGGVCVCKYMWMYVFGVDV